MSLDEHQRNKSIPYGLNYGCFSKIERNYILYMIISHIILKGKEFLSKSSYMAIINKLKNCIFNRGFPLINDFEADLASPVSEKVLFLT